VALGKGPVIARGANINPQVYKMLREVAKDLDIPYQLASHGRGTGTDANAMQLNQGGMATGLVSIPLRYMHTPCEVISQIDVDNTAKLLAGFMERVTPETDWTPSLDNLPVRATPVPASESGNDEKDKD
jgi:putative aminopeptidase FrvX